MKYDNAGPANDDFDVEFSDLPLDRDPTPAEKLVIRGVNQLTGLYSVFHLLPARAAHLLSTARQWLLARPSSQRFADGSTSDDIELEVADLPDLPPTRAAHVFSLLNAPLSFKTRFWRVAVIVCTIILTLAFLFSTVPQARGWISSLLARPKPTSAPSFAGSSFTPGTNSRIYIIETGSTVQEVQGTAVAGWIVDATPGSAPQGQDCPARPLMRGSPQFGRPPVWVVGFDGERATLHFAPNPVFAPVFSNNFGWTTSVVIEVQASYKQAVWLNGQNLDDGTPIFFNYFPQQGEYTFATSAEFNGPQPLVRPSISPGGKFLLWHVQLYFSAASCYELQAHWSNTSWTAYFSAGR